MGEQGDYDYTIWAEQVFTKNNSVAFQKMKLILELKKRKFVLKSKIHLAEQQLNELKEFIPSFEIIISKSKEYEKLTLSLKRKIKDIQDKMEDINKDILEGEKKQRHSIKENQKKVTILKKMLSDLYENSYDSREQKENRLRELEKEVIEYSNPSHVFEEQHKLENYVKEFELLKAKNTMLREMMSMNIRLPNSRDELIV